MKEDDYCINICKAKCCYYGETKCPFLTMESKCARHYLWVDNSCSTSVTLVRVNNLGFEETVRIRTRNIEYLLKNKLLPEIVENQCCYAHPELLKEK